MHNMSWVFVLAGAYLTSDIVIKMKISINIEIHNCNAMRDTPDRDALHSHKY